MRIRRSIAGLVTTAAVAAVLAATGGQASAAEPFTVTSLTFTVKVGPSGTETCSVVGDLYVPADASPDARKPAILTTNGFGGSKKDQAGLGRTFASRGYVVLSYSGLGFGGSGCRITLDDPAYDGKAAQQLVSYLAGQTGIAFTDAGRTVPAPALDVVELDAAGDPRVGMVGGSYGGQVQFAAASVDPRIDTIVPIITWSDLSYSLSPNNTSRTAGVQTSVPGAAKLVWALGFSGLGIADGLRNLPADPGRIVGCPNFAAFVCPSLVTAGVTGTVDPGTTAALRRASVSSYVDRVRIPTLVIQGQSDTLFNLNEGVANYEALQARGVETKMIWINGGHSGPSAPGEVTFGNPDPATEHVSARVAAWFDHHLRGEDVGTGPEFSYFRDWVTYSGIATPAYADADAYPVGSPTTLYLSKDALVERTSDVAAATRQMITPVAGLPTSTDPLDVIGTYLPLPETDLPGTAIPFTTPVLTRDLDVVGSPSLRLKVDAPGYALTQGLDAGKLVLFVKVQEVAPDGKATIVRNLVAPVRVPDVGQPFTVTLPAIVHRFDAGSRLRLVVAGGSTNYRGNLVGLPVSIRTGSTDQALTLPVVP